MALTADNVNVAVTGKVYVGATNTSAPSSATSTLAAGFKDLGYIDPDGVSVTSDKSTSQIRAWQNSDLIREVITEATATYTFMLMEANKAALELYYGSTLTGQKIEFNPANSGGPKSFVVDVVDGDDVIRHYIPKGEVTSVEAISFVNGEAVKYGVTVTAYAVDNRVADIFYASFPS